MLLFLKFDKLPQSLSIDFMETTQPENPSKNPLIVAWTLTIALAALFLLTAATKIMAVQEVTEQFRKFNLLGYLKIIGVLEAICAVLFLIPRTTLVGTLLLSAYFGGAIVAHMASGESFIFPAFVLIIIWVTAFLRNPKFFV